MTAALEGGEWSAACPGRTLPPGKTRYPFYRRLGGPLGRLWVEAVVANLYSSGALKQTVLRQYSRSRPTFNPTMMHICGPTSVKVKKKIRRHVMKAYGGGLAVCVHSFLNSALAGGERSVTRFGRLTPVKKSRVYSVKSIESNAKRATKYNFSCPSRNLHIISSVA